MAGILDWITEKAKAQYAKGAPYREAVGGLLQGDMNKVNQALSKSDLTPMDFATTFAPMGITAWHGSPHTFEKFDLSKIGTGEGAQAYGHGLYFAESPKVAETYKMPSKGAEATAAHHLRMYKTPENAIMALEDQLGSNITQLGRQHTQEAIDLIKSGKATTGNMYKVDIADETIPMMMDWNKSLHEQPLSVQQSLEKIDPSMYSKASPDYDPMETGQSIYSRLSQNLSNEKSLIKQRDALFNKYQKEGMSLSDTVKSMSPKDRSAFTMIANNIENTRNAPAMASQHLLKSGIPGISYFDAASRLGNEGTRNYVVFDPNTIKILERNGLLLP